MKVLDKGTSPNLRKKIPLRVSPTRKSLGLAGGFAFIVALFLGLALLSYDPNDLSFSTTQVNNPPENFAGVLGGWIAFALFMILGIPSYLLPVVGVMIGISALVPRKSSPHLGKKMGMGFVFVLLTSFLFSIMDARGLSGLLLRNNMPSAGGLIGDRIAGNILTRYIGSKGTFLLLIPLWLSAGFLFFNISWASWWARIKEGWTRFPSLFQSRPRRVSRMPRNNEPPGAWRVNKPPVLHVDPTANKIPKQMDKIPAKLRPAVKGTDKPKPVKKKGAYQLPTLQLLDNPIPVTENDLQSDLHQNAKVLEATLRDFGIDAEVVEVHRGPVITRYELMPAPGVKVNRITALSDDIALVMKAASIRIVAPIPGKAAVGIEVPNSQSAAVTLKEILVSDEFETSQAKIPLALGKGVSGKPIIADLTEMPHLLIAGATGSGKTVCVNSLILSILYTLPPEKCKLLLVDPKMVELTNYKNIPHLIGPVVTDPKKVSGALYYAVREMEKRYKIFAEVGVRNIEGFNKRPNKEEVSRAAVPDGDAQDEDVPTIPETMPYLVIIVDELADLMMISPVDIESAITRLAQLSRAVGIHIILATQRPSVDVITGVIKANFPARISFQVASKVDSRTILDANGADKLLGKGDMLFLPPGSSKLIRAQGTWLNDREIQRVIQFIEDEGSHDYNEDIFKTAKKSSVEGLDGDDDELYDQAVEIVLTTQQASASMLQRRLRVGYARAARLIDMMEQGGVVGAFRGSKARTILVKSPGQRADEEEVPE